MEAEKLKETICEAIDSHRGEIVAIGEDIRIHPELGFKEFRTAAIAAGHLDRLGIPHETGLAITGVRGLLKAKSSDITACQPDRPCVRTGGERSHEIPRRQRRPDGCAG